MPIGKKTLNAIEELWPNWLTDERRLQIGRLLGGFKDGEVIKALQRDADEQSSDQYAKFRPQRVVRILRGRDSIEEAAEQIKRRYAKMTGQQEAAQFYRLQWGKRESKWANAPDDDLLVAVDKAETEAMFKHYGYCPRRWSYSRQCHEGPFGDVPERCRPRLIDHEEVKALPVPSPEGSPEQVAEALPELPF